jgi:predicted nucleic acid-binding protein
MIVISDTTAISNLIQIGALNLLKDIYNEIIIPKIIKYIG